MESFPAWPFVIAWIVSLIVLGGMIVLIAKFAIDKAEAKDIPAVLGALAAMLNIAAAWLPRFMDRAANVRHVHVDKGEARVDLSTEQSGDPCLELAQTDAGCATDALPEIVTPAAAVKPCSEEAT